jgi:hypothetical protein
MGERRGGYWVLVGKPERNTTLGIRRHIWEHDIKMDLQERITLQLSVLHTAITQYKHSVKDSVFVRSIKGNTEQSCAV